MILPAHFYVYVLVLMMDHQRIPTGTAYQREAVCQAAAAEENQRASRAVHFQCEPLIVLKGDK